MDTIEAQGASRKRRQGQTMAEFAITLPTLLIIMFGIIEFGRIFQAWVTLQNSARTAARYASTGQYDTTQFVFNDVNQANPSDDTGFIPCVDDGVNGTYTGPLHNQSPSIDRRGTKTTIEPNGPGNGTVDIWSGDLESIFATWYDGKNCDPSIPDDLDRRKDMARILSIMQEARRGAAGLAIENNQWNVPTDPLVRNNVLANWKQLPWFAAWERLPATPPQQPLAYPPRSNQRNWFNVLVCSNRAFTYKTGQSSQTFSQLNGQDLTLLVPPPRFINYYSGDTLVTKAGAVVTPWAPACLLNEDPDLSKQPAGQFSHAGMPYMDPGTSDNTVYVTVTFNHPLITPLGIAPFITLQARRSSIVESFRTSGSHTASNVGDSISGGAPMPTNTPTLTPSPLPTATPIPSRTATATATTTKTPPGPFTCSLLSLANKQLSGNQLQIDIQNDNVQTTYITAVQITWPNIPAIAQMGLTGMSLNTVPVWVGTDPQTSGATTTTDTNTKPGSPPFSSTSTSIRELAPQDAGTFAASFNVPLLLSTYVKVNQYAITLSIFNPLVPATPCVLTSQATVLTATPTLPGQPTSTITPTPDCASSLIAVKFNSFDNFGIVRYDIFNQRNTTSTLVSIKINWQKYVNSQRLRQVSLGAPPGQAGAVVVWDSGNVNEDANPPTNSKTEGTWLSNYTLPAGSVGNPSITPVYFDFEGIYRYDDYFASTNPRYGGSSDFNFSDFELTCGTPGGSAGTTSGGNPTGHITPVNYPTPTTVPTQGPTNTPRNTDTPAPTRTPSKTPTIGPPTNTYTPKPPTATPPPSPTTGPQAPPTAGTGN